MHRTKLGSCFHKMKVSKSKLGCVFWHEPRETNANLERHKGVLQEEIAAFKSTLRNAQSDLQSFMELLDFDKKLL